MAVEIPLTKTRRIILETCANAHGAEEGRWGRDPLDQKAIDFLLTQQLLERRVGDGKRAMTYRLYITERGRAALRGDLLAKI